MAGGNGDGETVPVEEHLALLDYGRKVDHPINMGNNAWYTVRGDGKSGCKLRKGPGLKTDKCGEAPLGIELTCLTVPPV